MRCVLIFLLAALLAACAGSDQQWALSDVSGHLPDLEFSLTAGDGEPIDASAFDGKIVLLFFGFAHCPDVCPLTMTRLHMVLQRLGSAADHVRIAFVSVDPARDTPEILRSYVNAFDKRAIGMTGTPEQLRALTKRYRAVFDLEKPDADGNYDVSHSAAVYIFDRDGKARLIATSTASIEDMVHDLAQLLAEPL